MTPEAGHSSRPSGQGLPRSVIPFAGTPRTPRETEPEATGAEALATPSAGAGGEAFDLYAAIALTRAAEARLVVLEDEGRVRRAPRRPAFREAGPVGAAHVLRHAADGTGDVLAPSFRAAGALLAFGVELDAFFTGYLAGRVGPARGTGAELHHFDLSRGLLAPVVPLGLMAEVLAGFALGTRLTGQDRVAVVFDGEETTSTGAWHEGVAFAAARQVPLVLVVEASTADRAARRRHARLERFVEKAPGYGLGAAAADGSDALAVADAIGSAVARARAGSGVQMVEIRYTGADPLERLGHRLHAAGLASPDDLADLEADAHRRCAAAAGRAIEALSSAAEPPILRGVYAESPPAERRMWADPRISSVV